ncbi:alpha/beta fold hydrolase [Sediminibacterium soli]|uniref:alpha/beta fold hydrolase n=1 Tax=Sediminibacterium soli TaxID=2698829 RepID=UPI00137B7C1C|nr:alpha/beta hydrolase [Sediminibacterium soli]NCI47280.1 alpha/beta hydrolase [Sediminibacterium soli]
MEKQFRYQSATISYRMEGEGSPVVLLHGFGEDGHIWDEQVQFLKQYCLLLVPHLPGSGASGILHGENITISAYADVIHALLQEEKIGSCLMLGHSMGGYITLAFAEKYPSLLTGFGLVNSTAFADSEEKKKTRARAIETIGRYGAAAFIRTTIPGLFAAGFAQQHPGKVEALAEAGKQFSEEALQQYYQAMMNRPDRTAVLQSNPLPVLFVIGTEDQAAPMNDVLKQAHLPLKSYIHVLEHVGHMSMLEASDTLNRYLHAFINLA